VGYLYGDSTPSPLSFNFVKLLRDALDCSVALLQAVEAIEAWEASGAEREAAASAEISRLEALGAHLAQTLATHRDGGDASPTARCAKLIATSANDAVAAEIRRVQSTLSDELARIRQQAAGQRKACVAALAGFLRQHDLPDSTIQISAELTGDAYDAQLRMFGSMDLVANFRLDIPASHLFASPVRVDRLMDVEIQAPDLRGWLHKKIKLVPQRLGRKYISAIQHAPDGTRIRLRASLQGDDEFDLVFGRQTRTVNLYPLQRDGEPPLPPFEASVADAETLHDLRDRLVDSLGDVASCRGASLEMRLDGVPVETLPSPSVVVERMVAKLAPPLAEIAHHSLNPAELVLKRIVDDERREEVFVSKEELRHKLQPLSAAKRALFAPLSLDEPTEIPAGMPSAGGDPANDDGEDSTLVDRPPRRPARREPPEPGRDPAIVSGTIAPRAARESGLIAGVRESTDESIRRALDALDPDEVD
jgi:hypothetical protein